MKEFNISLNSSSETTLIPAPILFIAYITSPICTKCSLHDKNVVNSSLVFASLTIDSATQSTGENSQISSI